MPKQQRLISRLRRGATDAFIMRSLSVFFLFLMHTVLARALGPKEYGTFSYALALAGFLATIVPLGWPTAMMRFMAQYTTEKAWALLRGAFVRAHQTTFASSILVAITLWAISYWLPAATKLKTSLHFTTILLPIIAYAPLRRNAFQGLQRIKCSIVPDSIVLPILVILGAFTFTVTTASNALSIYLVASLVVLFFSSILLWRSLPVEVRQTQPKFQTYAWLRVTLPMVLGGLSQIIMNRTDVLMLGAMINMKAVGLYSAANRIAALNIFVLGAVNTIAAPMLAHSYHSGRQDQFITIFRKAILWSTLGALPLFIIMIIWPQDLLVFFGKEFIRGMPLLRVLAAGQFVNAVTGPVGFALLMTKREHQFAFSMAIIAIINIIGNFIIIPTWGALGAAWVTAGSIMILNGWQLWLSMRPNITGKRNYA